MGLLLALSLTLSITFSTENIFIACEGNFYQGNGSLWSISNDQTQEYSNDYNWDVLQSVYVYEDMLFVISNGSSVVYVFDITDDILYPITTINTNNSGPREMIVHDGYLYFTNWYSNDVKKINLETWELENEIDMPGLPEDIILSENGLIYVSITMNLDWTDGNEVVAIDPSSNLIVDTFDVGAGPTELLSFNGDIYVSRTYYDDSWNAFYGTSRITEDGVDIASYGGGAVCGGGIFNFEGSVYRVYDGGIAKIDEDLQILPETRIGSYDPSEVYSAKVVNDYIYFGLTDYADPDYVAVVDSNGDELNRFEVGIFPGDFAVWNFCVPDGDINHDGDLNVADIVQTVYLILDEAPYECSVDMNADGSVSVLDVIQLVQEILGIDSFRGAANWIDNHFPELNIYDRLKSKSLDSNQ